MLENYNNMFSMVSEIAKKQEEYLPLPSHEDLQKKWRVQMNISIEQLSIESKDKNCLEKVQDTLFNIVELFQKHASFDRSYEETKEIVDGIFIANQVEQRSEKWYEDMKYMITASEFSKLFDSERSRGQMVLSKIAPPEKKSFPTACQTEFMNAIAWGVRFEPAVRIHLQELWKCKIYESGRLKHKENNHLGASPDGIIIECDDKKRYGRLVEIKCPYTREVGKKIPFEYWCQMQIQMEVTNLNECEYVEVEIISRSPKKMDIVFDHVNDVNDSHIIKYIYLFQKDGNYKYAYTLEEKKELILNEYEFVETIEYYIKQLYNVLVKRDFNWYESTKLLQEKFWSDVKNTSFVLPESKRKKVKECLIVDE
jgi:hypothetical protein